MIRPCQCLFINAPSWMDCFILIQPTPYPSIICLFMGLCFKPLGFIVAVRRCCFRCLLGKGSTLLKDYSLSPLMMNSGAAFHGLGPPILHCSLTVYYFPPSRFSSPFIPSLFTASISFSPFFLPASMPTPSPFAQPSQSHFSSSDFLRMGHVPC